MHNLVDDLIRDLEGSGWKVERPENKLIFTRGNVVITGYQEHVTAQLGDFAAVKGSSKYWPHLQRLEFLVSEIRRFATMTDSGKLAEMARWQSAQNAIEKASWKQALGSPEALELIEKAVSMLQKADTETVGDSIQLS